MSKKRKHRHPSQGAQGRKAPAPAPVTGPQYFRQEGQRALKAGRYQEAIALWEKLDASDRAVQAAIAEACFRQAASLNMTPPALPYLERAARLVPGDALYAYALGVGLHKAGRLKEAVEAYEKAFANGLSRRGAGVSLALAKFELDPRMDLATVKGITPEDVQALGPLINLGRGQAPASKPASLLRSAAESLKLTQPPPVEQICAALGLLVEDKPGDAYQAFRAIESKKLTNVANAVRQHYMGVAAFRAGDKRLAVDAWKHARNLMPGWKRPAHNLIAVHTREALELYEAGNWPPAAKAAADALALAPGDPSLGQVAITALDRAAHDAARAGDFAAAIQHWNQAREILSGLSGGGTPRPLLHNLALAHEVSEQWIEAAEDWRAMLRTRPRKKTAEGLSDEHWAWVRRRVIDCYKRAQRPDQAIAVFRQALKADPDDADMQLDLVAALAASGQERGAMTELERLLEKHPRHVEALRVMAEMEFQGGDYRSAEKTIRQALEVEPDNPELKTQLARLLVASAENFGRYGDYARAREMYERALELAPDDYNIYFGLAWVMSDMGKAQAAREHVERGLELGRDRSEAYEQAFQFWIDQSKLNEARDILARGQASGKLTADFYVHSAVECLQAAAPPEPSGPEMFLGLPKARTPHRLSRRELEIKALGEDLIRQATTMWPEEEVLRHLVVELGPQYAEVAVPHARRLVELVPEDAAARMALGVFLGMQGQNQEAKDVLRKAAQLARKQGDAQLASQAEEARRVMGDPYLSAMMRMAPFLGAPDDLDDLDDEDWYLDDDDEIDE